MTVIQEKNQSYAIGGRSVYVIQEYHNFIRVIWHRGIIVLTVCWESRHGSFSILMFFTVSHMYFFFNKRKVDIMVCFSVMESYFHYEFSFDLVRIQPTHLLCVVVFFGATKGQLFKLLNMGYQ